MSAVDGCRACKEFVRQPANVHPEHVTHHDDGHHHVQCPDPPCSHYPEENR